MAKISAHQNPSTTNPGINASAASTNTALITNVKSPSVMIVNGNVKRRSIGLMKVFKTPRTTATIRVVVISAIVTPGSK